MPGIGDYRRFLFGFVVGAALAQRPRRAETPAAQPAPPADLPSVLAAVGTARAEAEQAEHIFGYQVIADVGRRSADAVRFLDALIFAVFAAQVAIYVLYIDKTGRFEALVPVMKSAFIFTVISFLPTLAVAEVPNPVKFKAAFPHAPKLTRDALIDQFIRAARRNQILRVVKLLLFFVAFGLTLFAVFTAGRIERAAFAGDRHEAVGRYWVL